jgi:hypothetical protein
VKPVLPTIFACILSGALVVSVARGGAAEGFRQLRGSEIRSHLAGMELTDNIHWALVFGKGGRLRSFEMSKVGTGAWRVGKDELCLDRKPDGVRCYEVWVSGRNVQLRHEPGIPEEGVLQKPQKRQ